MDDLKQAVDRLHHCQTSFLENVAVERKFGNETVWNGVISVFLIKGHPRADSVLCVVVADGGEYKTTILRSSSSPARRLS